MNFSHIAFVSYGNDSIAMLQYMRQFSFEKVAVVYNDTGWTADDWHARVKFFEGWCRFIDFVPFQTTSIGMEALAKQRKCWPRQGMQFCTKVLKNRTYFAMVV